MRATSFVRARTILIAVAGAVIAASVTSLTSIDALAPQAAATTADILLPLVIMSAGTIMVLSALRMSDVGQRRLWLIASTGVLAAAFAEAWWTWMEHFSGSGMGFPSLHEYFYLFQYAAWATAMVLVVLDQGTRVEIGIPVIEGLALSAIVASATWILLGRETLSAPATTPEILWYGGYVLVDVVVLVPVASALLLTLMRTRDPYVSVGWATFAAGVLIMVAADVGWFVLSSREVWQPGSLVDFGWMCGYTLMAVAASAALDAERAKLRAHEVRIPG